MAQLSQLYMPTRKAKALTVRTFVGKVMSLLFDVLSRFVLAFLPSSKCLLISWLQSLSQFFCKISYSFVVQPFSHTWLFATPWTTTHQPFLSFAISQISLKLMSIELVMPSNHLILCHPLLLLPSIFPRIRVFSSELAFCIRWPKYWSFSFSISPSSEYSGLISFRIDWFDLLSVQGTLKSLPNTTVQRSILHFPAFFMVQLSHPYMTTGKNHGFSYTDLCQQSDVSAFEYIV